MAGLCTGPRPPRYLSRLSIYLDFVPCYCCAGQSPPCYLQTLSICLFLAPFHLYFPNFLIYSCILFHSKSVLPNRWECNKSRTKESLPLKHPLSLLNSTLLQQVPAEAQVAPFLLFYLVHNRLLQVLLFCWSNIPFLYLISPHCQYVCSKLFSICICKCLHSRSPGSTSYPTTGASGLGKLTGTYMPPPYIAMSAPDF